MGASVLSQFEPIVCADAAPEPVHALQHRGVECCQNCRHKLVLHGLATIG